MAAASEGPVQRWTVDVCNQTVRPLWVFFPGDRGVRLVDQYGDTEDLTMDQYQYRNLYDTRERALRLLLGILRKGYNDAARELGEPEIDDQHQQGGSQCPPSSS